MTHRVFYRGFCGAVTALLLAAPLATAQTGTLKRATPVPADPRPGTLETQDIPGQDTVLCKDIEYTIGVSWLSIDCEDLSPGIDLERYVISDDNPVFFQSVATMLGQYKLHEGGDRLSIRYRAGTEQNACKVFNAQSHDNCKEIVAVEWR